MGWAARAGARTWAPAPPAASSAPSAPSTAPSATGARIGLEALGAAYVLHVSAAASVGLEGADHRISAGAGVWSALTTTVQVRQPFALFNALRRMRLHVC